MAKIICILLILTSAFAFASKEPINPNDYSKILGKGIDIDWIKTKEGQRTYKSSFPKLFKEKGFSHVRLRITEEAHKSRPYTCPCLSGQFF